MEKPVRVSSLDWTTEVPGDHLIVTSLPENVFTSDVYSRKLKGYLGFRGTLVARLQVNANKFQSGRLMMHFIPQGQVTGVRPGLRNRSLRAMSQQPRVELDLSCDTEVTMEIPYVSPTPFYNIVTGAGPFGKLYVTVYGEKRYGTGSSSCGVTLWVSFKDVELVTPALTAEAGGITSSKKKNASEKEIDEFSNRPISTALSTVGKAAGVLSGIPMLTSVAGTASWVLEAAAGAARAFGFSKPSNETKAMVVYSRPQPNMQNCDGVDHCTNMGLSSTNKVDILPGFAGTDIDEMTIKYVASKYAYYAKSSWLTTDAVGTVLVNEAVEPHRYKDLSNFSGIKTCDMTPFCYAANFFYYWRGSVVFKFKFVKTNFHSGRLLVTFNPGGTISGIDSSNYLYREIIDIRDTNEFEFIVPYASTKQYHEVAPLATVNTSPYDPIGRLYVYVLNELVCPDTVSSTIDMLVEVRAGDDFQVSCPRRVEMSPFMANDWLTAEAGEPGASGDPCKIVSATGIGSSGIGLETLEPAQYLAGEYVGSFLQLVKRFVICPYWGAGTAYPGKFWRCFTKTWTVETNGRWIGNEPGADYYVLISAMYMYERGSVRVMIYSGTSELNSAAITAFPTQSATILGSDADEWGVPLSSLHIQNWPTRGCVPAAQVPGYQSTISRLVRPSVTSNVEPVDSYTTPMNIWFQTTKGDARSDASTDFLRAGGDDLHFGYFIGVPCVSYP